MSTDFSDPPPDSATASESQHDYLPDVYLSFRKRYPEAADALDVLAGTLDTSGPLAPGLAGS